MGLNIQEKKALAHDIDVWGKLCDFIHFNVKYMCIYYYYISKLDISVRYDTLIVQDFHEHQPKLVKL